MAVLVQPNVLSGSLCMAGIKPFRYPGVYTALLRSIGREREQTADQRARG